MNTTLITDITVAKICDGFVYSQLEGILRGMVLFISGSKGISAPEFSNKLGIPVSAAVALRGADATRGRQGPTLRRDRDRSTQEHRAIKDRALP